MVWKWSQELLEIERQSQKGAEETQEKHRLRKTGRTSSVGRVTREDMNLKEDPKKGVCPGG